MQSVEIPAWAWGLLTMVMAGGMTTISMVLWRLGDRLTDRLDRHDVDIRSLAVDVAGLKAARLQTER